MHTKRGQNNAAPCQLLLMIIFFEQMMGIADLKCAGMCEMQLEAVPCIKKVTVVQGQPQINMINDRLKERYYEMPLIDGREDMVLEQF